MILGDRRLRTFVRAGGVENTDDKRIGPASIDLCLGHTFLKPHAYQAAELGGKMEYTEYRIRDGEHFTIASGEFLLATTAEYVHIPAELAAFVQGRSSIGRAGLTVQNAGFVDPGFYGQITLELKNDAPCGIKLYPGYPVAQLVLMDVSEVEMPYHGKYNGQVEATGSRMYMDNIKEVQTDGHHLHL